MRNSFTTAELARILGKPPRFVIDWSERGLFRADIQPASGPGSKRLFSYSAVLEAGLVLFLREKLALSRNMVRLIAVLVRHQNIIEPWHSDGTFIFKFHGGEGYSFGFNPKKMVELAKGEGFQIEAGAEAMICVDISRIKTLVDKGIEQLP